MSSIAVASASVVYIPNALDPKSRQAREAPIGATLDSLRPDCRLPLVCQLNGEYILAKDWPDIEIVPGDVAVFVAMPKGGDGGGSSVIATLMAIVTTVIGVFTGNPYLIAAGVAMLASALIPVPSYTPIASAGTSEQSPSYSLQLSGNSARIGQAIPVLYGYHILTPDFASQPYAEYDALGDQYYHALLCFGMAQKCTVAGVYIDDTPLGHFADVQSQFIGPSFQPTLSLVNPAVVNAPEVAQQDLLYGSVVGPFSASGPGLQCTDIGIDIVCPRGLYYAEDDSSLSPRSVSWMVEARQIDDLGWPTSSWVLLGVETLSLAENKAVRRSYKYAVTPGRYQVRMQRTSERDSSNRAANDIQWLGMRAYLNTPVTLEPSANYLAVRIRANSQLSGLSQRRITLTIQRWLPTWHPTTGWSEPVATNSIAWAAADVLRNSVYGGSVPDAFIDLQSLYQLHQVWLARGDEFNGIFDRRVTVTAALATVLRAGRARQVMRGSVYTFVRDAAQTLPRAMFNMRNIRRGSLTVSAKSWDADSADGVEVEFFSKGKWSSEYVRLGLSGDPVRPERIAIVGVTNLKQAQREAAYYRAIMQYRRLVVSFITELEGQLPAFGDLIAIAHDVPAWGSSGEISSWDGSNAVCSEPISFTSSQAYVIYTGRKGDVIGPLPVGPGTKPNSFKFLVAITEQPYDGFEADKTRYSFGGSDTFAKYAVVTSIKPDEQGTVQITAWVEDARIHAADAPYAGNGGGLGGAGPGIGDGGSGGATIGGRLMIYAPDSQPSYEAASDAQRLQYGFYSDDDGRMANDDEGYVYDY